LVQVSVETVAAVIVALASAISVLFWKLLATKDAQISWQAEQLKTYKEMFGEAVDALEKAANDKRVADGKKPFKPLAAVVPEHHSEVTAEQQALADMQTDRARLTAASLILELPPRTADRPQQENDMAKAKFTVGQKVKHPAVGDTPAGTGTIDSVGATAPYTYRVKCDATGVVIAHDFQESELTAV
jgi:hypothetical protein